MLAAQLLSCCAQLEAQFDVLLALFFSALQSRAVFTDRVSGDSVLITAARCCDMPTMPDSLIMRRMCGGKLTKGKKMAGS